MLDQIEERLDRLLSSPIQYKYINTRNRILYNQRSTDSHKSFASNLFMIEDQRSDLNALSGLRTVRGFRVRKRSVRR